MTTILTAFSLPSADDAQIGRNPTTTPPERGDGDSGVRRNDGGPGVGTGIPASAGMMAGRVWRGGFRGNDGRFGCDERDSGVRRNDDSAGMTTGTE